MAVAVSVVASAGVVGVTAGAASAAIAPWRIQLCSQGNYRSKLWYDGTPPPSGGGVISQPISVPEGQCMTFD
ncbi:hypothetical protein [Dactylosporangium darangshiense]